MAVVISGVNNNDKITATDGTIDLLSGVNFSGEVEVPSFKVGSNIQFGNAGIITATTLVGNVQGNINHTSNLLLQISGSEKFRVGTSGQLGIGGANYGTSGQVLTSGGSSSAASWTTITGTTINNNADNRVITGSGTANTLNGESSLTFNGTDLAISEGGTLKIGTSSNLEITSVSGNKARIQSQQEDLYIETSAAKSIILKTNRTGTYAGWTIETDGDFVPSGNKTVDIGSSSKKIDQAYLADVNCENIAITSHIYVASNTNIGTNSTPGNNIYFDNFYGSGANLAGILTATTVQQRTNRFYGLTTTDRNALSPSEGDIIYNTTTNKHEFYNASNNWAPISAQPPEFENASGSLATFYSESRSYVTPTSPTATGDAPLTYAISAGSLPSGMSINSSTGVLSGTPNAVGSDTTSNFTVSVSNAGGTVERDYSITVKAPVTTNYSYTGSTVNWSKPSTDVKRVVFRMWGGAGTHGTCTSNSQYPGRGGKTEGVINVENHNTLYLQVGEAGKDTSTGSGGWPNGGSGNIQHSCKGSGGGGSSNIYHSSGTGSYTYIVAVAGGGGSVSHGNPNSNGGDGGGTNGQSSNRGGGGASQNAGGSQGTTPCGNTGNSGTGTRLQGGSAGGGSGCTNAGAGGGGGWWGGGAGGNSNSGNTYGGGGGGSGYFDTSLVSGGSTKQASESGWDTNRPSGIAGRASYGNNNRGGHGYITLIY